jgi:undecaprenyl-diphosphatase
MWVKAGAGSLLMAAVLALADLALTVRVTGDDLRVDQRLSLLRFDVATRASLDLALAAQEAVGLAALALAIIVLVLRHRQWDAVRLSVMAGAAWTVALVVKYFVNRPRPPAQLWVQPPDPTGSFPSGHTTTAIVVFLIVCVLAWRFHRLRWVAIVLGSAYVLAVGISRLYLGDHYPTDILGSFLVVAASVLLVSALTDVPRIRQLGARLLRLPEPTGSPAAARPGP